MGAKLLLACSKDDRPLLLHGLIAPGGPNAARFFWVRAGTIKGCYQRALRRVTALECKTIRSALQVEAHKIRGEWVAVVVVYCCFAPPLSASGVVRFGPQKGGWHAQRHSP